MGHINKELFDDVFGDGVLDIDVEERHYMDNKTIAHLNKKKNESKKKCRKFKKNNYREDY